MNLEKYNLEESTELCLDHYIVSLYLGFGLHFNPITMVTLQLLRVAVIYIVLFSRENVIEFCLYLHSFSLQF